MKRQNWLILSVIVALIILCCFSIYEVLIYIKRKNVEYSSKEFIENYSQEIYSEGLKRYDEPNLYNYRGDKSKISYRFRFSHSMFIEPNPIFIRIDIDASKKEGILYYKSGSRQFYNEVNNSSRIEESKEIKLNKDEINEFYAQIKKSKFWDLPLKSYDIGLDGFYLTVEGLEDGKYHSVTRFYPKNSPFRRLCMSFIELSRTELYEINQIINYDILDTDIYDVYENKKYAYSIPYPKGWIIEENPDKKEISILSKTGDNNILRITAGKRTEELEKSIKEKSAARGRTFNDNEIIEIYAEQVKGMKIKQEYVFGKKAYIEFYAEMTEEFYKEYIPTIYEMVSHVTIN